MNSSVSVEGHQLPRLWTSPGDAVPALGSLGSEIVDLAGLAGLYLDPWQAWVMEQAHKRRDETYMNPYTGRLEYKWAAVEVGVMVSRQNGKGSILEARELAGLFLFGERMILHSAHQFDTAMEHMGRIRMLIESTPELDREVMKISESHGREGIHLRSGQRLLFKARSRDGARGFTGDTLVFDEAMILGRRAIDAMLPTLSARPNAQIWYTGSAGNPESEQFGRIRARALDDTEDDPRLFYCEWSAPICSEFCYQPCEDHIQRDSIEAFAYSNPGLGIRISEDHIRMELRSMSEDGFNTERLGVGDWPVEGDGWKVIGKENWERCKDLRTEMEGRLVFGVNTSPDGRMTTIVAAGACSEDRIAVEITGDEEVMDCRPGVNWVAPVLIELVRKHRPLAVVVTKNDQTGQFIEELEAAHVKLLHPNAAQYAQACTDFKLAVVPKKGEKAYLLHRDQAPLNAAVAGAVPRETSAMWAWDKRASSVDISPLEAATCAVWGLKREMTKKPFGPMVFFV